MNMDFGFGSSGQSQTSPFTTIAANPMFMSFADFDSPDPTANDNNSGSSFNFDMWTNSPRPDAAAATKESGLDELFGGNYLGNQNPVDFNALMMGSPLSSALSPVAHRSPGTATSGSSSSNSTSIHSEGQSPISSVGTSPAADEKEHNPERCPKTKAEAAECVKAMGGSPFVKEPLIQGVGDEVMGKMVSCASGSSSLPSTEPKDDNVEVLAAWRGVTTDPHFKVTLLPVHLQMQPSLTFLQGRRHQ
jgi:AP-1-like factor